MYSPFSAWPPISRAFVTGPAASVLLSQFEQNIDQCTETIPRKKERERERERETGPHTDWRICPEVPPPDQLACVYIRMAHLHICKQALFPAMLVRTPVYIWEEFVPISPSPCLEPARMLRRACLCVPACPFAPARHVCTIFVRYLPVEIRRFGRFR